MPTRTQPLKHGTLKMLLGILVKYVLVSFRLPKSHTYHTETFFLLMWLIFHAFAMLHSDVFRDEYGVLHGGHLLQGPRAATSL